MTLEEAVAKYVIERDAVLDELHPFAADYPDTSISWHRERDKRALDAVVKDVMLAAIETQPHLHEYEHVNSPCDPSAVMEVSSGCPRCCCEAEVERLFEGGKE